MYGSGVNSEQYQSRAEHPPFDQSDETPRQWVDEYLLLDRNFVACSLVNLLGRTRTASCGEVLTNQS
jgi:hypothetical protein